jgi:hypothetical protein
VAGVAGASRLGACYGVRFGNEEDDQGRKVGSWIFFFSLSVQDYHRAQLRRLDTTTGKSVNGSMDGVRHVLSSLGVLTYPLITPGFIR